MRIKLREREQESRRWSALIDQRVSVTSCTRVVPLDLNESSDLAFTLHPDKSDSLGMNFDARVLVGNFPVASTLEKDRPDFHLRPGDGDDEVDHYFCVGRLLRDWVGQTELVVQVARRFPGVTGQSWTTVLGADLNISAGKIEQEEFEALCAEVADYSAGMLLDVFGKTFVNLQLERRPGETIPVLVLQRVRHV